MEIVKKENVYSGFLKLTKNKIKLNNGEYFDRELVLKNPGVAIVAVTKDNRIFLTKQPRAGAFLDESIEIPAGIIEGENVIDAAKRELLEETGCVAEKIIELRRLLWRYFMLHRKYIYGACIKCRKSKRSKIR